MSNQNAGGGKLFANLGWGSTIDTGISLCVHCLIDNGKKNNRKSIITNSACVDTNNALQSPGLTVRKVYAKGMEQLQDKHAMKLIEYNPGHMSLFIWTRSYMCAILHKDMYSSIRPLFSQHSIECIVQTPERQLVLPSWYYERDAALERTCCFMTMKVGKTREKLHLHDNEVYMIAWNTWYPMFIWRKYPDDILSKIRKIHEQVHPSQKMSVTAIR